MVPIQERRWVEMFQWVRRLILVTFLWDPHHIRAWEDRVQEWDLVVQALDIQVWEDQVLAILEWGDLVQDILGWGAQVQDILEWVDQVQDIQELVDQVQVTLEWVVQAHCPCLQKRSIHLTSQWFSTHRTRTLHPSILAAFATKKSTTMIRQSCVNLGATSGSTVCVPG